MEDSVRDEGEHKKLISSYTLHNNDLGEILYLTITITINYLAMMEQSKELRGVCVAGNGILRSLKKGQ